MESQVLPLKQFHLVLDLLHSFSDYNSNSRSKLYISSQLSRTIKMGVPTSQTIAT